MKPCAAVAARPPYMGAERGRWTFLRYIVVIIIVVVVVVFVVVVVVIVVPSLLHHYSLLMGIVEPDFRWLV